MARSTNEKLQVTANRKGCCVCKLRSRVLGATCLHEHRSLPTVTSGGVSILSSLANILAFFSLQNGLYDSPRQLVHLTAQLAG